MAVVSVDGDCINNIITGILHRLLKIIIIQNCIDAKHRTALIFFFIIQPKLPDELSSYSGYFCCCNILAYVTIILYDIYTIYHHHQMYPYRILYGCECPKSTVFIDRRRKFRNFFVNGHVYAIWLLLHYYPSTKCCTIAYIQLLIQLISIWGRGRGLIDKNRSNILFFLSA